MDYRNEELRVATSYQERGNGDCFARLEENSPESGGVAERFDQEGIEIPFPHRTLYTGDVTAPFPIRIVENPAESKPGQA